MLPLILQAETEWLKNAPETYGNDAGEVWAGDIFRRLLRAELQDIDLLDLRLYAPVFLEAIIGQSPEHLDDDTLRDALTVFHKAG